MNIYHFHPTTGEFLGVGQADPDPMNEGEWLLPAFSTDEAPPAPEEKTAWLRKGFVWEAAPDHRGEVWWDENGSPVTVTDLGDPADLGLTDEEPAPPAPTPPVYRPSLFASAGLVVSEGFLTATELAAQLQGAIYEEGWLMVMFSEPQEAADYLVFAQTDIPAKVEQFKDGGSFELVFTNPATGDPVEPGRVDLQILKIR